MNSSGEGRRTAEELEESLNEHVLNSNHANMLRVGHAAVTTFDQIGAADKPKSLDNNEHEKGKQEDAAEANEESNNEHEKGKQEDAAEANEESIATGDEPKSLDNNEHEKGKQEDAAEAKEKKKDKKKTRKKDDKKARKKDDKKAATGKNDDEKDKQAALLMRKTKKAAERADKKEKKRRPSDLSKHFERGKEIKLLEDKGMSSKPSPSSSDVSRKGPRATCSTRSRPRWGS